VVVSAAKAGRIGPGEREGGGQAHQLLGWSLLFKSMLFGDCMQWVVGIFYGQAADDDKGSKNMVHRHSQVCGGVVSASVFLSFVLPQK